MKSVMMGDSDGDGVKKKNNKKKLAHTLTVPVTAQVRNLLHLFPVVVFVLTLQLLGSHGAVVESTLNF